MAKKKVQSHARELMQAAEEHARATYVMRLYVAGLTPKSRLAIQSIRALCEQHLKNRYELEIIDIYQQPELLQQEQIIVAPTLIKQLPLPLRRLIGDMSDKKKIIIGLDLKPTDE